MVKRMDKEEIIRRLKNMSEHVVYEVGKPPFMMSLDDGEALYEAVQLLKEQETMHWISVKDGMPEERDTIFAKLKGTDKWKSAMFEKMSEDVRVVVVFEDGTRSVHHSYTVDGEWDVEKKQPKRTVTHWMPNPELPKEDR